MTDIDTKDREAKAAEHLAVEANRKSAEAQEAIAKAHEEKAKEIRKDQR